MQLEFATGADGEREARVVQYIVRIARDADPGDAHQIQLLDQLERLCCGRLGEGAAGAAAAAPVSGSGNGGLWRRLFGPSRREMMLSEQRNEALARAERAERSSFEALTETARVARERDALKARVAELEAGAADGP